MQKYLSTILKGSSLSYVEAFQKDGTEDKEHSRRVSFRIILK
jgi:UDP-3-O-acyl-N-acetylglucosamine deacetylase